jgi:hypothetical protein
MGCAMNGLRLDAIDFWRGVVLAIIFINHIPGNVLGALTPRNFNFSDASEAFVFISGVSVALAYGRRFRGGGALPASLPLIRRAFRLYFAHLALTGAALALFAVATTLTGQEALLAERGCATACLDSIGGLLGFVTLSNQISYFNILPLYVVLLVLAPLLFGIGVRSRWSMLCVSAGLYVLGRWLEPGFRASPDQAAWYFNPAAWQFMFTVGIFVGLSLPEGGVAFCRSAYRLALAFSLVAAVIVSNAAGVVPGLVDRVGAFLDWSKTDLGVVRIIAFLALAYSIYCSQLTLKLKPMSIYPAFSLLGRNALPVFCLGSLLSALGQILNETWMSSPAFDVIYVAAGLLILFASAKALEHGREMRWAPIG